MKTHKMSRTLTLTNFKCHRKYTLELPEKGIILLDGKSGMGKTTILEAISFVLYETGKNSCYPRTEGNKKRSPMVELVFESGLKVLRKKNPGLLQVTHPKFGVMVGQQAQSYIDQEFGSLNAWLTGGYIKQDEYCAFFSMTAAEKLACLQEISSDGNSKGLLNLIDKKLVELDKKLQEINVKATMYQEMYTTQYELCGDNPELLWTETILKGLAENFQLNIADMVTFSEKVLAIEKTASSLLIEKVKNIGELISVEQMRHRLIQEVSEKKRHHNNISQEFQQMGISGQEIAKRISDTEGIIQSIKEKIFQLQSSQERTYLSKRQQELIDKLGPEKNTRWTLQQLDEYSRIVAGPKLPQVEATLTEIDRAKQYRQQKRKWDERCQLLGEIANWKQKYDTCHKESVQEYIEKIDQKLWYIEMSQKVMECPQCDAKLYLNQNKLQLLEGGNLDIEKGERERLTQEKSICQNQERSYRDSKQILEKITALEGKLTGLPVVELPPEPGYAAMTDHKLEHLYIQMTTQKTDWGRVPQELATPEEVIREKDRLIVRQQLRQVEEQLEKNRGTAGQIQVMEQMNDLQTELVNQQQMLQTNKANYNNVIRYETKLEETGREYGASEATLEKYNNKHPLVYKIDDLNQFADTLIKEHNIMKQQVARQIELSKLDEYYTEYQKYETQGKALTGQIEIYKKIHATIVTAEHIMLERVLTRINVVVEQILNRVFEEPISLRLRSLRQLKTNERIKPGINVEIYYKGAEFNNLNELSGGERSRVSIALMIAFSQLSNIPFLLLDESLSNLDIDNKEIVMKTIRDYLADKLILTSNHDTTEGICDRVIKISQS